MMQQVQNCERRRRGAAIRGRVCLGLLLLPMAFTRAADAALEAYAGTTDPATLPAHAGGYAHVDAVAIDAATLAAMSDAQLGALVGYAASCGRLLLVGAEAAVADTFRRHAGCDAAYLATTDASADRNARFEALLALPLPPGADDAELERLVATIAPDPFDTTRLGVAWLVYLVMLTLLLAGRRTRPAALAFAVLATTLVPLAFPPATTSATVAWAEAGPADRHAPFRALTRTTRFEAGELEVAVDRDLGAVGGAASLVAHRTPTGSIRLCNAGAALSRTTHARVQGEVYRLPPLPAGEEWIATDAEPVPAIVRQRGALALFTARAGDSEVAVLDALDVGGDGAGWLMRRLDPDGDSTCTG